jgi:hypothetical protein
MALGGKSSMSRGGSFEFSSLLRSVLGHYYAHLVPKIDWHLYAKHYRLCRQSAHRLERLRNMHAGQTIYCVGNGPSLKQQNLDLLDGKMVLLTNRAFALLEQFSPAISYNVVGDVHGFNKMGPALITRKETTFVSAHLLIGHSLAPEYRSDKFVYLMPAHQWIRNDKSISPVVTTGLGFSRDIRQRIFWGYSVIFGAIQIACYLGAKRVVLLGVDMNYTGDASKDYAIDRNDTPNWIMDYAIHAKPMFEYFVKRMNAMGVEFLNATLGGKLDCVPRVDLEAACRQY